MRRPIVLFVLFALLPVHAAAQEWKDAYDRHDFLRSQQLLQPIVFGTDPLEAQDPLPFLYLATIYADGYLIPRDEVLACAIMFVGYRSSLMRGEGHPLSLAAEAVHDRMCGRLTPGQREEAMAILPPCVRYGLREQTFDLGPGHSIEVSRRGFTIDFENKHEETPLWNCPQQVPVVRYTRLEPRAGTDGQPRHIIELFVWREGGLANQRGRMLEWWLTEVVGSTLANAGAEVLVQEPGSIWPPRGVPETIDVRFRWNKQGEATYTITGVDKTRTGVLPPPRR